ESVFFAANQPVGIVVTHDGFVYFTTARSSNVWRISPEEDWGIVGGGKPGFADGVGTQAQFRHLTGIALDHEGNLIVADSQNYLVRKITLVTRLDKESQPSAAPEPFFQPSTETLNTNANEI